MSRGSPADNPSSTASPSDVVASFPDPDEAENVLYDPDLATLRSFSAHLETTTEYGSPSYVSEFRSRSADRTKNTVDDSFTDRDYRYVREAVTETHVREMVCVDRVVGRHPEHSYCCRLFVPKEYARIALAWAKLLEPADGDEPDFYTVQLPDREETRIRVLADEGVTAVLGSDYTGEAKKSFLRLFMYRVKQAGGLGLHAGTKRVRVERDGGLEDVYQVFLGLSGTGKSTLTGHGFWLSEPECAEMLQDDVCALLPDGAVVGSEGGGLYIKTIDLAEDEQPRLYRAATQPHAVLENVGVDDGRVYFADDELTSNSRAVILRDDLESAADDIDCPRADQVFFITRNPAMPPIARLSAEEAAAAFMLGESIETSAGDPEKAGEPVRVVGTNPFIMGPEGEEGNRFADLVEANDIEPYVLNTGQVGEDERAKSIEVDHTVRILTEVARGTVEWTRDPTLGLDVPSEVPGLNIEAFDPAERYDDYESALAELRAERRSYLGEFETLREGIKEAVY